MERSESGYKPLQVNPLKHSAPMGATLAFLGVDKCMPLMHAAQGCASYTKVFFTRHFNEPIAVRNTSVSDLTAILDGGEYSILMALENIHTKEPSLQPSLIGLHTTGLTETKGDDVRGVGQEIQIPYVYVNTPDYEGGMESGWGESVCAMIEQLTLPSLHVEKQKVVILPHVSMTPLEVEKIKVLCEECGYKAVALPDLSLSLDGYWEEGQGKLANGGISVEQIKNLATASQVFSIGESMKKGALALCKHNPLIVHSHFDHVMGLEATDNFVASLMKGGKEVSVLTKRWRSRLQDAMLDTHFLIGKSRFVVTGEPDMIVGICEALSSVGGIVSLAVSTVASPLLSRVKGERVIVGDLEDATQAMREADVVISNFHSERFLQTIGSHAVMIVRGFPNYEEVGNALKSDHLYEGSAQFLFEVANAIQKHQNH